MIVMACCIGIMIAVMIGDIANHMANRIIVVMGSDTVVM